MQVRGLVLSILMLVSLLTIGGIVTGEEAADEMCIPMGIIALEPPDTIEAKREIVEFPHNLHFSYACADCHHKWDREAAIEGCMTSGCHDLFESPLKTQAAGTKKELAQRYFKNAYHDLCVGCHKQIKTENKALEVSYRSLKMPLPSAGPTGCHQCHPKE